MSLKEDRKVMENDIYIVKKKISTENFLLKLNRQAHQLEVYKNQMSRLCGKITASERILTRVNIRFMKKSRKCHVYSAVKIHQLLTVCLIL